MSNEKHASLADPGRLDSSNASDLSWLDSLSGDCQIVCDLLPLYAEQLASPHSILLVEKHLDECPDCRQKLEALQAGDKITSNPADVPLENALKKVNRKFHWHRRLFVGFGLLVLVLAIGCGTLLGKTLRVSAQDVEVLVDRQTDEVTTVTLVNPYGKMFFTHTQKLADGNYELSGWSLKGQGQSMYPNVFALQNPVNEVSLNGQIIYQDGTVISPRCLKEYAYANGYAGDLKQMHLAMPSLPDLSFHIEANTDDPDHCIWSYILNPESKKELVLNEDEKYILRSNALLALALTPNLSEIRYCSSNGQEVLSVSRTQLAEQLKAHGLNEQIASLADLQKIMNIVLPPAG